MALLLSPQNAGFFRRQPIEHEELLGQKSGAGERRKRAVYAPAKPHSSPDHEENQSS